MIQFTNSGHTVRFQSQVNKWSFPFRNWLVGIACNLPNFGSVVQALASGKPANVVEKMVQGRLRKYFEETVLLDQKFVINDAVNVQVNLTFFSFGIWSEILDYSDSVVLIVYELLGLRLFWIVYLLQFRLCWMTTISKLEGVLASVIFWGWKSVKAWQLRYSFFESLVDQKHHQSCLSNYRSKNVSSDEEK